MKKTLLIFCLITTLSSISQTNYNKEVYPLIKSEKYTEALTALDGFLKTKEDHGNANYWYAKLLEEKGNKEENIDLIKLSIKHYKLCQENVDEADMSLLLSGRWPDASGRESAMRLDNFKRYLDSKMSSLERIRFEPNRPTQPTEPVQTKEVAVESSNDMLNEAGTIEVVKLLGVPELEKLFTYVTPQFTGVYDYNEVKGNRLIKGDFDFSTDEGIISLAGSINDGNGNVRWNSQNAEAGSYEAIKLEVKAGKITGLRAERLEANGAVSFYESSDFASFDIKSFVDESMKLNPLEVRIVREILKSPMVYLGPVASSDEGGQGEDGGQANCNMLEFGLLQESVQGKVRVAEKFTICDDRLTAEQLKLLVVKKNYEIRLKVVQCESMLFGSEPTTQISSIKETKVFVIEEYAKKNTEKISAADLATINGLAKKWYDAVMQGDFEAYKKITPVPTLMLLEDFTRANKEFNKHKSLLPFKLSNNAILTDGQVSMDDKKIYDDLKKAGCDMNNTVVTLGNLDKGGFHFVKQNGVWKCLGYEKTSHQDEEIFNAYKAIKKEKPSINNLIDAILNENMYDVNKYTFFFRYSFMEYDESFLQFYNIISTKDYCRYLTNVKTMKLEDPYGSLPQSSENKLKQKELNAKCK